MQRAMYYQSYVDLNNQMNKLTLLLSLIEKM